MKKVIFTFLFLSALAAVKAQTTFYWVGGSSGSWGSANSWSLTVGGAGGDRSTPASSDILVFDGTNLGSGLTGAISLQPSAESIGQLKLQKGADLSLARTSSGTTYLVITGLDGSADLTVDATSKLSITGSLGVMALVLETNATGDINGNVFITGTTANRMSIKAVNSLNFLSGSSCTVNSGTNPFSTLTTGTNPSVDKAIQFQSGSSFIYQGGLNPFGTSATSILQLLKGSHYILEGVPATNMFVGRTLGNVIVRNNISVALAENFFSIDTLTINAGSTFNIRATGTAPIAGNIINNGTFGAAAGYTTAHLIFIGTVPQTIGGSGIFTGLGAVSVATDADVTLNTNLSIGSTTATASPTSTITGKLNMQTYSFTNTGATTAGPFNLRGAATATSAGTLTSGSNTVTLNSTAYATANVTIGALVSGTGIPANSYIIATSSAAFQFTISKPATLTTATDAASVTITSTAPTLTTANTAGVDGSIATTGTRNFGAGANYVFNAATTAPFTTVNNNAAGNVTFNAAVTTNKTQYISGTLTLNNGIVTIRPTDTLRVTSGNAVAGTFSASRYFVTAVSGANTGVLAMDAVAVSRTFPVGTATVYLPVTLTPTAASDFSVSAFQGVTANGAPDGTALTSPQKNGIVDAVWIINRTNGTGNCDVTVNWVNGLEGSSFSGLSNGQVGISRYDGSAWTNAIASSANNTTNTATASFSSFSPFGVGQAGATLPVQLSNIAALLKAGTVAINWQSNNETGIVKYVIERSSNGNEYIEVGSVPPLNATAAIAYNWVDANPFEGTNYYRIKMISTNGEVKYSSIVTVKRGAVIAVSMYPNPVINTIYVSGLKGGETLAVYDVNGKLLAQKKAGTGVSFTSMDASLLPQGTYMLTVSGTTSSSSKIFIKK